MVEVRFYDTVNDELLKFAVIISQSNGKWVFCKHKERDTYEVPGGKNPPSAAEKHHHSGLQKPLPRQVLSG